MPYPRFVRFLAALAAALLAVPGFGQVPVRGAFTSAAPDSGWSLAGSALLTAPAIDAEGAGWLRLTGNSYQALGAAFSTGAGFSAARGMTLTFSYVAWGGGAPGADGISVFLYDAAANMAGAQPGGALGYCKGAGAWLAVGLDEYGNFSHPQAGCDGGAGPGLTPQALVLRGPTAHGNPFIAHASVPGKVDHPLAQQRPAEAQVALSLLPKPAGPGYRIDVDWRPSPTQPWTRLLNKVDFPYQAPAALRLGVAAATGGARNIHEVRHLTVQPHLAPTVSLVFEPSVVPRGGVSTLVFQLGSGGNAAATLREPFSFQLPIGLKVASVPQLGGSCPAMVRAVAGGSTVTLESGSVLRAAGCTVTVNVIAQTPGSIAGTVPAGAIITDMGSNLQAVTGVLTVRPRAR